MNAPIPPQPGQEAPADCSDLALVCLAPLATLPTQMLPTVIAKLQSLTMELLLRFLDETLRTVTAPLSASLELFTVEEAARMMKVPTSHVYDLVRTGQLPHIRVGKKYIRIPIAAFHDWLAHQRAATDRVDSAPQAGHTRAPRRRQATTERKAAP